MLTQGRARVAHVEHRRGPSIPVPMPFHVLVITVLLGAVLISLTSAPRAASQPPATLSEAIGFLAREKTIGESGASLLKTLKPEIANREYWDGFRKYADAKAKFDEVIAQLKTELASDASPQPSPRFQEKVQVAAEERIAFTSYVDALVEKHTAGTKAVLWAVIFTTVAELLPSLTDAVVKIWQEYRQASAERRQEITRLLADVTWRPFTEIEAI